MPIVLCAIPYYSTIFSMYKPSSWELSKRQMHTPLSDVSEIAARLPSSTDNPSGLPPPSSSPTSSQ